MSRAGQAAGANGAGTPGRARSVRAPRWLARQARGGRWSGRLRLVETTLLVLVALLLTVATVNDLVRQTGINHRLVVDLRTRSATLIERDGGL